MARAIATCICDKCGKTFTMESKCKFRNRSEANNWEQWAANNYRLCRNCYVKDKQDAEADQIADTEAAYALPDLKGSKKQIAWARQIRHTKINDIVSYLNDVRAGIDYDCSKGYITPDDYKHKVDLANIAMRLSCGVDSAAYWIDNRNYGARYITNNLLIDAGIEPVVE